MRVLSGWMSELQMNMSAESFEDSVNIPLSNLRDEMFELVFNTKYIICCDTGRRSESAGFLLSHKGFDVYVLEGGIPATSSEIALADRWDADKPAADVTDTDFGSQAILETEAVPGGFAAHDEELASLRAENEKLLAEIIENQSAEARLKEQIEQQRGELCELAEKLSSLYAQVQSDTVKMQLLQDQYAALQEQHAEMVDAHKLDIEQLYKELSESQSQAETIR